MMKRKNIEKILKVLFDRTEKPRDKNYESRRTKRDK